MNSITCYDNISNETIAPTEANILPNNGYYTTVFSRISFNSNYICNTGLVELFDVNILTGGVTALSSLVEGLSSAVLSSAVLSSAVLSSASSAALSSDILASSSSTNLSN